MVVHPKEYASALSDAINDSADLREIEQVRFGIDHCMAGHRIAGVWKFSHSIAEVALHHHQAPNPSAPFNLLELVKTGVLMADSLGYHVVPPQQAITLPEVAAFLPAAARVRFSNQMDVLPERIAERIRSLEL
jgi:hypothetical protein